MLLSRSRRPSTLFATLFDLIPRSHSAPLSSLMSALSVPHSITSGLPPFDFTDLDRDALLKVLAIAAERLVTHVLAGQEGVWMKHGDELGLREAAGLQTSEGRWTWFRSAHETQVSAVGTALGWASLMLLFLSPGPLVAVGGQILSFPSAGQLVTPHRAPRRDLLPLRQYNSREGL